MNIELEMQSQQLKPQLLSTLIVVAWFAASGTLMRFSSHNNIQLVIHTIHSF